MKLYTVIEVSDGKPVLAHPFSEYKLAENFVHGLLKGFHSWKADIDHTNLWYAVYDTGASVIRIIANELDNEEQEYH